MDARFLAGGLALLAAVILLSATLAADAGDALTRNTVRLSLAWYALVLLPMMRLEPADWLADSGLGRLARWCWTWGAVCFLTHLAMAFHFYHHWSHADAFEHTRRVGGVGEGIYLSYLFTLLWATDAIWWWAWPQRFAARSPWIDRALHAFMLFMVFNGTIVFESGAIRWASALVFAALVAVWLRSRGVPRMGVA